MLTTKDKMYLRKVANKMNAVFQIGHDGINDNMVRDILLHLEKNELMKVKFLETCPMSKDEIKEAFINEGIEIVQVIGHTFVLYLYSPDCKNHVL